uniref:Putative capsid protein n=1 Tax=viral metagenome TaxID=1070528 RepID=A0A6M3XVP0_9ZZZZ
MNVTALTRTKILPGITDQIGKDLALFRRLWGKAQRISGGRKIEQVVKYAQSTQGGWYAKSDTLDAAQEDTMCRAYFDWRAIHQPIVLFNLDIAMNRGPEGVFDLVRTEGQNAMLDLKDKVGTAMFTAQTGNAMDSLVDACDDGTNVSNYGDISRSSFTWWKGNYNGTGGSLSLSMLATQYDLCRSGSDVSTILVTDKTRWTAYEALLQPQARYTGTNNIDGGFQTLYFRGTPMIDDEYVTAGYFYFLSKIRDLFTTLQRFFLWLLCPEKVSLSL